MQTGFFDYRDRKFYGLTNKAKKMKKLKPQVAILMGSKSDLLIVKESIQVLRDFGVPFTALAKIKVEAYKEGECPLCMAKVPIAKPGSKK